MLRKLDCELTSNISTDTMKSCTNEGYNFLLGQSKVVNFYFTTQEKKWFK